MATSQPNGTHTLVNGHAKDMSSYAAKHKLPAHFIGGNHLEAAQAGSVKDFVASNDGHTVITSVRLQTVDPTRAPLTDTSNRSLSQTMELQQSKKFDRYENGPTKHLETSEQSNLR